MDTVHAVYENGVFRPTVPVDLPEHSEVEFVPHLVGRPERERPFDGVFEVLSERYDSGKSDIAARHNEHQP